MSGKLREEGNKLFRDAQTLGLSPALVRDRLNRALSRYAAALSAAEQAEKSSSASLDRAAAEKNLGAVHARLANILPISIKFELEMLERSTVHYLRAAAARAEAWSESDVSEDELKWLAVVDGKGQEVFGAFVQTSSALDKDARLAAMHRLLNALPRAPAVELGVALAMRARVGIGTARAHFELAVRATESLEHVSALSLLRDSHRPLHLFSPVDSAQVAEVADLQASIDKHIFIAESCKARVQGELALQSALHKEEYLLVEDAWDAVDFFRSAAAYAQEGNDLENEAIALTALAGVLEKVFHLMAVSTPLYRQAFRLGLALWPKHMNDEKWFQACAEVEDREQAKLKQAAQDEEDAARRAEEERLRPAKESLTVELGALKKAAAKGVYALIVHIYSAHPPRAAGGPHVRAAEVTADTLKRDLLNAMRDYHPDRNGGHDDAWCVLCLEITKELVGQHEKQKHA
ncbi:hypothetical protein T492DRAFT_1151544 [Pavlovales sp. CCMP2436]|nr:hypothetical protein T492DRAFT_1151544 [Pavlovales sp. CCMP2436]